MRLNLLRMADVTYNTASFPSLIRTVTTLAKPIKTHRMPLILLGYKERDPAERSLWSMAADVGINFTQVSSRTGAGQEPVEIWIGKMSEECQFAFSIIPWIPNDDMSRYLEVLC